MHKTSVETPEFTTWVNQYLTDDGLLALQRELMSDPGRGDVIPGCGGLRKLRIADPSRAKGKRGGARLIYLHVDEVDVIYLMDIYGKGEQEDLTADQKKILKMLAEDYKRSALKAAGIVRRRK